MQIDAQQLINQMRANNSQDLAEKNQIIAELQVKNQMLTQKITALEAKDKVGKKAK